MSPGQKLEELAAKELPSLIDHVILEDGNCYRAFGKYTIQRINHGYDVYCRSDLISTFGSSRAALAWCIADRFNKLNLARQIQNLDQTLSRQKNSIHVRKQLAAKSPQRQFSETTHNKVLYRQELSRCIEEQLSKCINSAKYWQLRGFDNEIARTSRNTINRTSR